MTTRGVRVVATSNANGSWTAAGPNDGHPEGIASAILASAGSSDFNPIAGVRGLLVFHAALTCAGGIGQA